MNKLLIILLFCSLKAIGQDAYSKCTSYIATSRHPKKFYLSGVSTYNNKGQLLIEKRYGRYIDTSGSYYDYSDTNQILSIKNYTYNTNGTLNKVIDLSANIFFRKNKNLVDTTIELMAYNDQLLVIEKQKVRFGYQHRGCLISPDRRWGDTAVTQYKYDTKRRLIEEKSFMRFTADPVNLPGLSGFTPNLRYYSYDSLNRIDTIYNYFVSAFEWPGMNEEPYSTTVKESIAGNKEAYELSIEYYNYKKHATIIIEDIYHGKIRIRTNIEYVFNKEKQVVKETNVNITKGRVVTEYEYPGKRLKQVTNYAYEGDFEQTEKYVYE